MYLNFVNGTEYICDASYFQKNNTIIIIIGFFLVGQGWI